MKSPMQDVISRILEEKGYDINTSLAEVIDIAFHATKESRTWEEQADYKTRLNANKLLLELWWYYTPSSAKVNVNLGLAAMIQKDEKKPEPKPTEGEILEWS